MDRTVRNRAYFCLRLIGALGLDRHPIRCHFGIGKGKDDPVVYKASSPGEFAAVDRRSASGLIIDAGSSAGDFDILQGQLP